jgi:hypothetical protein
MKVQWQVKRQYAHADEVGTVDSSKAFGDDGLNTEQHRTFGRLIAR